MKGCRDIVSAWWKRFIKDLWYVVLDSLNVAKRKKSWSSNLKVERSSWKKNRICRVTTLKLRSSETWHCDVRDDKRYYIHPCKRFGSRCQQRADPDPSLSTQNVLEPGQALGQFWYIAKWEKLRNKTNMSIAVQGGHGRLDFLESIGRMSREVVSKRVRNENRGKIEPAREITLFA